MSEAPPSAAADLEVRPFDPARDRARDPAIEAFVLAHPRGSVFHLPAWREAVQRVFGHPRTDLLALSFGEVAGLLPLSRCKSLLGPAHLVSVAYGVYGGPLGASPEVERALVAAAIEAAERARVGRLELRCREDPGLDLPGSALYATFVRDLPGDPEDVMRRMPKRARAEVRKAAEKHGLELVEGPELLPDLARLFGASKQRLGSPGLPAAWFEALVAGLGSSAVVQGARRRGEVVAATLSFASGGTFSFYYIGTSPEANREWNATNFLTTRLQEWAAARGLARFDLGRSRVGTGAYEFKLHQGFEPAPLAYRYHLVRSRGLPTFTPSNPRTRILRDAWARLPAGLATRLSARLSRYLP